MRLVLVRHGETVGHSSIRYYGRTDVALSDLGRRQMRAAREWLAARDGASGFARYLRARWFARRRPHG
jgi:broad specificity phosphatase PhoE